MKMKYLIEVTQVDIDTGKQHKCFERPVALAILRSTGMRCRVDGNQGVLEAELEVIYIRLPESAVDFQNNFDIGRPVIPFSFEIEVNR